MGTKKITELTTSTNTPLSGFTVISHGNDTFKLPLSDLKTLIVDNVSHTFNNNQIINANLTVTGNTITNNLTSTGTTTLNELMIGNGEFHEAPNNEKLHVATSGSSLIAQFFGDHIFYSQLHVKNKNSSSTASSDIVVSSDNGTDFIHFIDLGINSSTYSAGFVGEDNDAYLINVGKDLYIGTIGNAPSHYSKLKLFGMGNWQNPEITIDNTTGEHLIGFNSNTVTSGYTFEFNGNMKLNDNIKIDNVLILKPLDTLPQSPDTGTIFMSGTTNNCTPYYWDGNNWVSLI